LLTQIPSAAIYSLSTHHITWEFCNRQVNVFAKQPINCFTYTKTHLKWTTDSVCTGYTYDQLAISCTVNGVSVLTHTGGAFTSGAKHQTMWDNAVTDEIT